MNQIDIKLDAEAMSALFPEGSVGRLKLQETVMNEIVRKLVDRNVSNMHSQINEAVRIEFQARLAAEGIKIIGQKLTLSDPARKLIADQAAVVYNAAVFAAVNAVAEPELDSIRRKLQVALDTGLRAQISEQVKIALRGVLS
jgi:anionic cell wall polymer biosynthesis LytR-Cps2A-Psr (LCP) family protein